MATQGWEPDLRLITQTRRLAKQGHTAAQIFAELRPPTSLRRFETIMRRYGIPTGRKRAHCGNTKLYAPAHNGSGVKDDAE